MFVVIPLNRVKVSTQHGAADNEWSQKGRNPLKSGQGFNHS